MNYPSNAVVTASSATCGRVERDGWRTAMGACSHFCSRGRTPWWCEHRSDDDQCTLVAKIMEDKLLAPLP